MLGEALPPGSEAAFQANPIPLSVQPCWLWEGYPALPQLRPKGKMSASQAAFGYSQTCPPRLCLFLLFSKAVQVTSISSERPEQTEVTRGRWHCAAVPSPARAVAHTGALHIHLCLSTGELWCEQEMLLHAAHPVTGLNLCLSQLQHPFPSYCNRKLLHHTGSLVTLSSPHHMGQSC